MARGISARQRRGAPVTASKVSDVHEVVAVEVPRRRDRRRNAGCRRPASRSPTGGRARGERRRPRTGHHPALVLGALEARAPNDAWRGTGGYGRYVGPAELLNFLADNGYPLSDVERIMVGERMRRRRAMLATRRLVSPPIGEETLNLVFPSRTWGLRDPNNVQHEWQRVREALGLPDDVTVYSFRKLVATVLDDAGLSARMTADVLQHADPAMTQRKYMARGRAHPEATAAMDRAVVGEAGRAN